MMKPTRRAPTQKAVLPTQHHILRHRFADPVFHASKRRFQTFEAPGLEGQSGTIRQK